MASRGRPVSRLLLPYSASKPRGIITPPSLQFVLSHGYDPPDIGPRQHRLMIHGLVDRPLIFTLEDLQRLPSGIPASFLESHGNSATSGPNRPLRMAETATVR